MEWTQTFVLLLILQLLFIPGMKSRVKCPRKSAFILFDIDTNGNANRRRRRRRQTSGSLYGTNANLGASAPAGFNYPANTNIQGIRLNNPDARDLLGNPIISTNAEGALSSVNLYNQPRPQQQQVYGTNDQSLLNTMYNGNNYYSGGTSELTC